MIIGSLEILNGVITDLSANGIRKKVHISGFISWFGIRILKKKISIKLKCVNKSRIAAKLPRDINTPLLPLQAMAS